MTPEIMSFDPSWPYSKAKTAVLSAASAVVREEGPRAATLKNIATRAGITEPAIFRHFDGVDGLFGGLFSVYERLYGRSSEAYSGEGRGLEKLRAASFAVVDTIAASRDFAYILVYARHVFRGYPELKAQVAANDAKDQERVLACINEGIKAGEVRTDIDPVSAAVSLIGGIYVTTVMWIESGFGFDLRVIYGDRWDDFERMVASKPSKSREVKAAVRERSASYFPLRPAPAARGSKAQSSKKAAEKAKAKTGKAGAKAASKPASKAGKSSPRHSVAAKAVAKKPSVRGK
jgi:AcrR family transcriptional regulator